MTPRVQRLLDFHGTRDFGNRANLIASQREARSVYAELTPDEQAELADTVIADPDGDHADEALCCLACFHPGSLAPFHGRLLERRLLYPGVIYHGADGGIAAELMTLLDEDKHRNHALLALAWIGDETVQAAFARWREQPPSWASRLYVPPERYADEAGWELTPDGSRRNLFSATAFPLTARAGVEPAAAPVRTGVRSDDSCPWCGRRLSALLAFEDIGTLIPNHGPRRVTVLTCDVCTCYGIVFAKNDDGQATWHPANARPEYLPPDSSDWDSFPDAPLVLSGDTRHYLEAANWSMLPGISFSQVGGLPTWIQDAEYPACPDCSQTMPFVGQVSNEDFMDHGEGIYYAFHCPQCDVTATHYQQT